MQLYLNFHDYIILVSTNEEALLKKIEGEFHYFVRPESPLVDATVDLFREVPPELPPMVASKILETCTVYRLSSRKYIDYRGEALTIKDEQEDTVRLYSLDTDRLYEMAFLAIHSMLGEALDKKGFIRIHALSVGLKDLNAVVMLPSKGGKSTLLTHLLENPDIRIISDDMPLIDSSGQVHVFPSKVSVDKRPEDGPLAQLNWTEFKRTIYPPKWTASLAQVMPKIETNNLHQKTLLIAGYRLSQGQSILTKVSKWKMLGPLLEHMIMGYGLPQVLEMFLKFNFTDIIKMAFHGILRSIAAFHLLRKSGCYHFYMGPDREFNAQLILDELYEQQNT